MRRLNVREAQIDACIRNGKFALHQRPRNPELQPGEVLLLQLTSVDANATGTKSKRINFALVFESLTPDQTGEISRYYWPNEGRTWNWIVNASMTVPTVPFSLEELPLSRSYAGQTNAFLIAAVDEDLIKPYIQWALAETSASQEWGDPVVQPRFLAESFGYERTLDLIFNHDRVEILAGTQPATELVTRYVRNQNLGDALKSFYDHRCQICEKSFRPRYEEDISETHHIRYLRDGGMDLSSNIVVLCPDHHRVVHATSAEFDSAELSFRYPNGLVESLILPGHFVQSQTRQRTFDLLCE